MPQGSTHPFKYLSVSGYMFILLQPGPDHPQTVDSAGIGRHSGFWLWWLVGWRTRWRCRRRIHHALPHRLCHLLPVGVNRDPRNEQNPEADCSHWFADFVDAESVHEMPARVEDDRNRQRSVEEIRHMLATRGASGDLEDGNPDEGGPTESEGHRRQVGWCLYEERPDVRPEEDDDHADVSMTLEKTEQHFATSL